MLEDSAFDHAGRHSGRPALRYVNSPNNWIVQLAATDNGVVARTVSLRGS